jgi:hypothetical protein
MGGGGKRRKIRKAGRRQKRASFCRRDKELPG